MSMRDYSVVAYGVVLNNLVDDDDLLQDLVEGDSISSQFSFTGESFKIKDNGNPDWGQCEDYRDDTIYYVELPKYPSLFKAAYKNMRELVTDMVNRYNGIEGLPKLTRKKVRESIRLIQGTYYG